MRLSTENKLSLEVLRKIDPNLINLSDEELLKIRDNLYQLGSLSLESYLESKQNK